MHDFSETYIGDGCYASFDGYQIKLRAPRLEGDHEVYLEPDVFQGLIDFARVVGLLSTKPISIRVD